MITNLKQELEKLNTSLDIEKNRREKSMAREELLNSKLKETEDELRIVKIKCDSLS